jgi:hypothetical protein
MQTLSGLVQAIKYHLNVSSNTIITDDSALGYINIAEDHDLSPLRGISMKKNELITLDSLNKFNLESLTYPVTEMIGVYFQYDSQYQQQEYLQYVDPITFGRGYGSVYSTAIYTIRTSTDGNNNQELCIYPAPGSAKVGVEYYADWPKLGDLTSDSLLQQLTITTSGTATAAGTISIKTTVGGIDATPITIPVAIGDTADAIHLQILGNYIPYQALGGNNTSYWAQTQGTGLVVDLFAPEYNGVNATITVTGVPAGLTITVDTVQSAKVVTVQSNWFLWQFPYLYYYAALKHAYNGLDDIERYQLAEKEFLKACQVFQGLNDKAEWSGSAGQPDYNTSVIW